MFTAVVLCSLDTGRLNAETYQLFDAVEKHYGIRIEYTFPDAQETMDLVRAKGMFSFYEDGHGECCRVRKVGTGNMTLASRAVRHSVKPVGKEPLIITGRPRVGTLRREESLLGGAPKWRAFHVHNVSICYSWMYESTSHGCRCGR